MKRGGSRTGLANPVLGAVRRLTAKGALRATTVRRRSDAQRATGDGQRATGNEQRATGDGQRATGSFEKRCCFHGVSKPRVGRRSKTHGERCASRDHRQTAQRRAASDGRRATSNGQRATGNEQRATSNGQRATGNGRWAHLKRGVASTGLANPVLGAVRRLTAEGALRATTVRRRSCAAFKEAYFAMAIGGGIAVNTAMGMALVACRSSLVAGRPLLRRLTVVARSAPSAVSLRTAPDTGFANPV